LVVNEIYVELDLKYYQLSFSSQRLKKENKVWRTSTFNSIEEVRNGRKKKILNYSVQIAI
jgi:hypothetical protein